jgi:hypothetical protein
MLRYVTIDVADKINHSFEEAIDGNACRESPTQADNLY